MRAQGNGEPQQCVFNLLHTVRGEVPYARLKGMNSSLIDVPSQQGRPLLEADAEWLIKTYEPRAGLEKIGLVAAAIQEGQFQLDVKTAAGKGDGNGRN